MSVQSGNPTLMERMVRASRLDPTLYEEVERDRSLMGQAVVVVVLVSIASSIDALGETSVGGFIGGLFWYLIGWALLAWLTYFIGTRLFPEPQTHADWGQLARVIAYAQSPGMLSVVGFIPVIGPFILFVTFIWVLAATIVAVRHALDYQSTWRAAGVVLTGYAVFVLFSLL